MDENKNIAYEKSTYFDSVAPTPAPIPTPAQSSKKEANSFMNTKANPNKKRTKDTDSTR